MPIYEYQCNKCGTFEASQRITDNPLSKCPTCKGKVKKLISNTSFQLKGTGWYITDYARKEKGTPKTENGSAAPANSESKSSTETKSETKKGSTPNKTESSPSSSSTTTS